MSPLHDLRFALRTMRKSVLATATIVLCLGVGIGATGTVIAWMESAVFQPVDGVREVERLVTFETTTPRGVSIGAMSYPAFRDLRDAERQEGGRLVSDVAAFGIRRFLLRTESDDAERHAEPVWGLLVSANYFDALGVRPALGRGFMPNEDSIAGAAPVMVISHALWQRRFAGDRGILGRRVWLNGRRLTVVGVLPPDFVGTISRLAFDVWVPVTMHPQLADEHGLLLTRGTRWLQPFGRLATAATLSAARAGAQAIGARLAAAYEEDRDHGLSARTLDVGPVERMRPLFVVMLGITVLVLLIVCSNVANLLLLRGAAREHELAVRLALGASPARLVRQLMTESLLLALTGVVLGVGIAAWGKNALSSLVPASPLPIVAETPFDTRILLLMAAIGVATVFVFGLAPALRVIRAAGRLRLTGGTRGATLSGARVRGALVGTQFALSLAVLVAAGLFLRRLDELRRVDRGFRDPERVLLSTVDFELGGVRGDSVRQSLVERLVQRIGALPGVTAASAATFVPLGFLGYSSFELRVDGYVPRPGENMSVLMNRVGPRYFETMGVPIVRGRAIEAADRAGTLAVAVVNEAFARRFWPGADPLGRSIRTGGNRPMVVVGVAADGKYEYLASLDDPSPPFVYVSFAQWPSYATVLHVRTARGTDPLSLYPAVRRAVADENPSLDALSPSTLESTSSVPLMPMRVGSRVLGGLGIAALALAALGLYAVIGYAIAQRTREIGVRMALGATPGRLVGGFLAEAARYAGAGAAAGIALASLGTWLLVAHLPGAVPRAATARLGPFAIALGTLAAVALVAALIPATRATRVSPAVVLREE